jgi:acylphosphatase
VSEQVRRRAVISGRVQGVGFRAFVAALANELGVSGSALNRRDGAVECVLEGPPDAVGQVVVRLHKGPPWARVTAVEVTDEEPLGAQPPILVG